MYEHLNYVCQEGIAHITINRPKALNALNSALLKELFAVFTEFRDNDTAKVAIVTGAGRAFVAGADISEMQHLSALEGKAMMSLGHQVMNLIEAIPKPVIAAINGFALGGGCELAMACDVRIASDAAKFGQPEVNLGIIPGFGGTQRLPRLVGKGMGKYLIMTAEMIDAAEAFRIGLVEKVVSGEDLLAVCEQIAKTMMAKGPIAIGVAKTVVNHGFGLDMTTASVLESEACAGPFASEDRTEGMRAFLGKRTAEFQGK